MSALLCLPCFTPYGVSKVRPRGGMPVVHSCLLLNNMPLYKYSTFIHPLISDGHSGYFQFLAIGDNALDISVQVSVWMYVSFLLSMYLGVEFLGHTVTLCLIF